MSSSPPDPLATTRPVSDSEPAEEITEFYGFGPPGAVPKTRRRTFQRRTRLALLLFTLTCVSVFVAGLTPGAGLMGFAEQVLWLFYKGRFSPAWPSMAVDGLIFCGCLMAILFAHEMGHYLQSIRHRVPATLPYFLPLPISPFGTLGAVIIQDGRKADRRQLFDIAVSGPLAGLLLTLPIACYGIATSRIGYFDPREPRWGDPLLIRWIAELFHGPYGADQDILINAPLFAGWVGVFITALNLLPVGQFDGGHILYTLIGRKAHVVAYAVLTAAIGWIVYTVAFEGRPPSYVLIVVLLLVFGPKHPPTADDAAPLGLARMLIGWLTLAFFVVGFTPTPII